MYDTQTYFDGTYLETLGIVVERVHDELPKAREEMVEVPGRDGSVMTERTWEPRTITLDCRVLLDEWDDFERAKDALATIFNVGGERRFSSRAHPDGYYLCHLQSMTEEERNGEGGVGMLEVTLVASDPTRYGEPRTVAVPSASSATFTVTGNMPPRLSLSAASAVWGGSSDKIWSLNFDGTAHLHVPLSSSSTHAIEVDCQGRTVKVDNAVSMVTLDSDWPVLSTGTHTVTNDHGSGASTLTIQERWI